MRIISRNAGILAISTMLVAMPFSPALAQDVDAALARLKVLVEEQGGTIDWANANVAGANVELVDVEIGGPEGRVPIGNVVLEGISEVATGYRIERMAMDYYTVGDETGSLVIDGLELSGVILPDEANQDALGGFVFYETADLSRAEVVVEGRTVFTLTDVHAEISAPEGDEPMTFTGAAEGFSIDLSIMEDPDQYAVMEALGYGQLSGYLEMDGMWDRASGQLVLSQYDLTVVDAGTVGFTFHLGGYTTDFVAGLRAIQQEMAANPDGDSSAQGFQILGLMQQLSLAGAEIAFLDDGLTNKVLEFIAQQQGMRPVDIANQAKAVVPFLMAQLNNRELTAMVTRAVSTFLDDPQSIRITAEPDGAVPFSMIMAGAMTAPQDLPSTLGVVVVAND